jgi:hypothetical protein
MMSSGPSDKSPLPNDTVQGTSDGAISDACLPLIPSVVGSRVASRLAKVLVIPIPDAERALAGLCRRLGTPAHVAFALRVPEPTVRAWRAGRFAMRAAARSLVVRVATEHGVWPPKQRKTQAVNAQPSVADLANCGVDAPTDCGRNSETIAPEALGDNPQ